MLDIPIRFCRNPIWVHPIVSGTFHDPQPPNRRLSLKRQQKSPPYKPIPPEIGWNHNSIHIAWKTFSTQTPRPNPLLRYQSRHIFKWTSPPSNPPPPSQHVSNHPAWSHPQDVEVAPDQTQSGLSYRWAHQARNHTPAGNRQLRRCTSRHCLNDSTSTRIDRPPSASSEV